MPTPAVADPFGGAQPPGPNDPKVLPDGSIHIPASFPAAQFVRDNLLDGASLQKLADDLEVGDTLRAEAAASKTLVPKLEAQLQAAQKQLQIVPTLEAEIKTLQTQVQTLATSAVAVKHEPAKPAVDEQGKPLGEFKLLPKDPFYRESPWVREKLKPRVAKHGLGAKGFGLTGIAGGGKTYGVEQWAASEGLPFAAINCKGDSADDWIAYREAAGGSTSWKLGRLTQAIVDAGDKAAVILLDEVDMACEAFKYLLLSILDMNPAQRRVDAPCGQFPVGRNLQFFVLGNGTGTNPASRHRGTFPQALLNRLVWIPVPLMSPAELSQTLALRFPALPRKVVETVAGTTCALMISASRSDASGGSLDVDVSIRTAIKVLDDWHMGPTLAWEGALLGCIEDNQMRSKAEAIISTGGIK